MRKRVTYSTSSVPSKMSYGASCRRSLLDHSLFVEGTGVHHRELKSSGSVQIQLAFEITALSENGATALTTKSQDTAAFRTAVNTELSTSTTPGYSVADVHAPIVSRVRAAGQTTEDPSEGKNDSESSTLPIIIVAGICGLLVLLGFVGLARQKIKGSDSGSTRVEP